MIRLHQALLRPKNYLTHAGGIKWTLNQMYWRLNFLKRHMMNQPSKNKNSMSLVWSHLFQTKNLAKNSMKTKKEKKWKSQLYLSIIQHCWKKLSQKRIPQNKNRQTPLWKNFLTLKRNRFQLRKRPSNSTMNSSRNILAQHIFPMLYKNYLMNPFSPTQTQITPNF